MWIYNLNKIKLQCICSDLLIWLYI